MLALGLMLAFVDPPDWDACETVPWGADVTGMDWTRDTVVPGPEERRIHVRACGLDMGFAYTHVLLLVWNGPPRGTPATLRLEQGVTACSDTAIVTERGGFRVRTGACGYGDEEPIAWLETRLRWTRDAPFVTVVE